MKVAIIGAGQLGSRHLQALRNIKNSLSIYVSDPSVESLKVAKDRYESLPEAGKHSIEYSEHLPAEGIWDLIIIATNAGPRAQILKKLLERVQFKNMILEKILFNNESDYHWAQSLCGSQLQNVWVNCCMRQMPIYRQLKEELNEKKFNLSVSGGGYGLVTNAIHYLDYAAWLAGTPEFILDTSALETSLIESKRKGYAEANGTLVAKFSTGAIAAVTCYPVGNAPTVVEVHAASQRHFVLEAERKALSWQAKDNWVRSEREAIIPYQSQLTTELVNGFAEGQICPLPKLAESIQVHLNLLNPLREFLKKSTQIYTEDFPFT